MEINPAAYGGKIQVHGGAVVAFSDSVTFGVEMVGALNAATLMTAAFGGSGINLVTLSGDGPVLFKPRSTRSSRTTKETVKVDPAQAAKVCLANFNRKEKEIMYGPRGQNESPSRTTRSEGTGGG